MTSKTTQYFRWLEKRFQNLPVFSLNAPVLKTSMAESRRRKTQANLPSAEDTPPQTC